MPIPSRHRSLILRATFFICIAPAAIFGQAPEAVAPASQAVWQVVEEQWYIAEMDGQKAGWMHSRVETDGSHYRTINNTAMELNRGDIPLKIRIDFTFTETKDGKPVLVETVQDMSAQAIRSRFEFKDDHVLQTQTQGGRDIVTKEKLSEEEWLTMHAASEYCTQQRQAGAEMIRFKTITPDGGLKVARITCKRMGEGTFEQEGQSQPVSIWQVRTSIQPSIIATEHYTSEGTLVFQEVPLGPWKFTLRLADEPQAMAAVGGGGPAPEMMFETLVTPDKPIENSLKTIRAKLKLSAKSGEMPELPQAGAQRFALAENKRYGLLTIDINDNLPASSEEMEDEAYLAESAIVNFNDELVKKLSARAVKDAGNDPMAKAEALHAFVHQHISKKSMATAFASASETARTRTGDCSEHGVLLCAMLRAHGIPARIATGLVYVDSFAGHDGIFGWHMWTQALIEGKWVDFDATLPAGRRYNAVHILTNVSSLKDGLGAEDLSSVLMLMGNLNVEVVDVEYE